MKDLAQTHQPNSPLGGLKVMVQRERLFSDRPGIMLNRISIAVDNKNQGVGHLKCGAVDGRGCFILSGMIGTSIAIGSR
ncbi:MAG: hypothetical protein EA367_15605 [Leptolyngbya sp. DLM2.Bin15]|nr:MAG: hypothetical protein EA367_15605 [Leptolyngbya sp. DLM2.Bin15]